MRHFIATFAIVCCVTTPALAINKCKTADGKVIFQDMPCAPGQGGKIEVTPASGQGVSTPGTQAAAATGAPAQTETERLQQLSKKYRDTSRLDALQSREIPGLRNYLDRQKNRCDAQVAALRSKQGSAKNNLAGATYLQSIAVEMSTVATQCDTDVRLGSARLQDLLKEESALKTVLGK